MASDRDSKVYRERRDISFGTGAGGHRVHRGDLIPPATGVERTAL